jgi:dTDP-4-amino-4,6-dideoxygalactose transaminase
MPYSIPLSYNPIDSAALAGVLSAYQHVHHNRMVEDFEKAITGITGVHAVALNSGTAAIHLAMKVLGVGKNDVILAPSFTYIATVNPALYLGAIPAFIDSEPGTWNMSPGLLEKTIQESVKQGVKPKAIIITHTYGMPSDLEEICRIAEVHEIPVIEDAAESFGADYKGRQTGTFGRIGIYSFNNNKTFTTYGGGVLLTPDPELAQKARFFASQARENLPYYEYHESGFNYLMGPLNAAYGLSQLAGFRQNVDHRRSVFNKYKDDLSGENIEFQVEKPGMRSSRWFSTILFKNKEIRAAAAQTLAAEGIETRPLWRPMHAQPLFAGIQGIMNGVADNLFERGLCLPSGNNLKTEDQERIVQIIRQVTSSGRAGI